MSLLTDITSPAPVTAEVRAQRLDDAGAAWSDRIDADRASSHLTYRVKGSGEGAVATRVTAGGHAFLVDEPAALAGDDVAASPVEYALGALVSCQVVVYRLYANALGIPFDDIEITATGHLDAARLFGKDSEPRAGFQSVELAVSISGAETQERYQQLAEVVDAHCPVLDLFSNPTPVTSTITAG